MRHTPPRPLPWAGSLGPLSLALFLACGPVSPGPEQEDSGASPARAPGPPFVADLTGVDDTVAEALAGRLRDAEEEPTSAAKRAALGMAYEVNGLLEAALRSYSQAAELDPGEPKWHYYRAQMRSRLGDLEGALESIDQAIELAPHYAPAELYRGLWALEIGDVETASQAYQRATTLDPDGAAGWIGFGRVLVKQGEAARALDILEPLAGKHPRDPQLHQALALAYRLAGRMSDSQVAAARAQRNAGWTGWPDPWQREKKVYVAGIGSGLMQARALLEAGRFAEAAAAFEDLRKEQPGNVALLNNLSIAYRRLGEPKKSIATLLAGLEIRPDYYPFHLNLAAMYRSQGDVRRALQHLDHVIEVHPTLATTYERKGDILLAQRRLEEALAAFSTALRYDARSPDSFLKAGVLEAELGNWAQAVSRLEDAVRLDPDRTNAHIALAMAQAETCDLEAAEQSVARAAALVSDARHLDRARNRLEHQREVCK